MKRFLSLVLSAVLIITVVGNMLPSNISVNANSDEVDTEIDLLNSNCYPAPTHVNSDIVTKTDKGIWLGTNANTWISTNLNNQDAPYMGAEDVSGKILERNKVALTDVGDFEWQFQYRSDNTVKANASFVFHINDNSIISSYASRKNIFAVTLYGSGYEESAANYYIPNSLNIEYPNAKGEMRPYKYDTSVSPWLTDPESYVKLDDASAEKVIDLSKYFTVNIKMEGRTITVSAWQTENKAGTYREQSVSITNNTFFNNAPSGDFAIISGKDSGNYKIKDMTISTPRLIDTVFDSSIYTNQINTAISDTALWFEEGWAGRKVNNVATRIFLNNENSKNNSSGEIFKRNKIANTDVGDFHWQFQINANKQTHVLSSFCFNVNENSNITDFASQKNLFSVTLYGSNYGIDINGESVSNALVVQQPNAETGLMETTGSYIKLDDSSAAAAVNPVNDTIVSIKLIGRKLTVAVWNVSNKSGTYRENVSELDKGSFVIAPSGDFAVIAGGTKTKTNDTNIGFSNMTVTVNNTTPDVVVPEPEPDAPPADGIYYSNDFEENSDGIVIKSKAREPEKTGLMEDKLGNQYLQITREASKTNTRGGWSVFNIDPENSYTDFTLRFKVRLDAELNSDFSLYNDFMLISFRSGGNIANANVLQIAAKGAAFSVSDNSDSENPKTYTNNRIAYAGNDFTDNKTFKLPNGYVKAGLSADGVWHQISLVVDGWTYKYYMDGVLMLEVEDPEKLYKEGIIHINACREDLQIDDVKILTPDTVITPFDAEQLETGLIYANDFESEADLERINVTAGTYSIVADGDDSYFHIDYKPSESNAANGDAKFYFGPSGIKNFTLNFNVRITNNPNAYWHSIIPMGRINSGISVQARLFTKGSYLAVQDDTVINEVARTGPADPNHKGKSPNPYHDKNYGISIIEWHKVSLVCDGWKYSLYVDGVKILEGVDDYQLSKWGSFGIRTQGVSMDIDNIRVWGTPYYDLDYVEEVPTGTLYENDFEDESLDGIKFIYYDQENTTVKTEESGNKFLRAYPNTAVKEDGKPVVTGNGNMLFSIGPPNAMDFELTFRLRMKSNTNENSGSAIIGIHSDPTNIKWNTVWLNILARGTSVSLKDNSRKLGIDNLIASTGKNRSGGTQYQPSDNRAYGIRPDGRWHDIKVVVKGYTYTLYVDGNKYLTATDPDETFYKGYTVIGSNNCKMDIDDIKLINN